MKRYIIIIFILGAVFAFLRCGNVPGGPELPGSDPVLCVDPQLLDFGEYLEELTFNIKNLGSSSLNWAIMEDCDWMECSPIESQIGGQGTGEIVAVTVSVDRSGGKLCPENRSTIDIFWNRGIAQIDVVMYLPSSNEILGQVYFMEESQELPVEGASVYVYGVLQCETDVNGEFVLDYEGEEISLSVEHPNFEPWSRVNVKPVRPVWRIELFPNP
jgi:hypothetical protein